MDGRGDFSQSDFMDDLFGQPHCTKGWEKRCGEARHKDCDCGCGGKNHGILRTKDYKLAKGKKKELKDFVFFHKEQRRRSPEVDFGVWWRDGIYYPTYRVSWIELTGELYAFNQMTNKVEVLGKVKGREAIEKKMKGWVNACGKINSLDWIRRRFK